MQKGKFIGILLSFCVTGTIFGQQESYEARAKRYIDQYKDLAIAEQKRSGVPAAITLAQGIHETSAGNSELAQNANNHFGIKCKKEWRGDTYKYTDDSPNECFRKYPEAVLSYKDHSDYLRDGPRYAALFALAATDYEGWAKGLKKCGYATNPQYAQVLIKLVEDYHLQVYTYSALKEDQPSLSSQVAARSQKPAPAEIVPEEDAPAKSPVIVSQTPAFPSATPGKRRSLQVVYADTVKKERTQDADEGLAVDPTVPVYGELVKMNNIKAFYAKKGSVLLNDAIRFGVRYAKLLEINDLPDAPLEADMYIYLDKKHAAAARATHTVAEGETLTQIAQKEGIQLKYLKAYNKIGGNEEVASGAVLQLQKYAEVKPATYAKAKIEMPVRKNPVATASTYISKKDIEKKSPKAELPTKEKLSPIKKNNAATAKSSVERPKTEAVHQTPDPVTLPPAFKEDVSDSEASEKDEEVAVKREEEKKETPQPAPVATNEKAKKIHEKLHEEPEDEYSRLKAQLDKVVYSSDEVGAAVADTTKVAAPVVKEAPQSKGKEAGKFYVVKKGDTAFSIARRHNITMRQLMAMNKLDFETVKPGQQLRIK